MLKPQTHLLTMNNAIFNAKHDKTWLHKSMSGQAIGIGE